MKIALRFAWMIVSFLAVEVLIFLPLFILGLLVFPLADRYALKYIVESNINHGEYVVAFRSPLLNEWLGNREDGLLPSWWAKERSGTAYGWFLRNPVSNMRFRPLISTVPRPEEVGWVGTLDRIPDDGKMGWFFCWEGWYSGLYWQGKSWGFWLGWKTNPRDRFIDAPKDYRYYGLGTVCQLWRNK